MDSGEDLAPRTNFDLRSLGREVESFVGSGDSREPAIPAGAQSMESLTGSRGGGGGKGIFCRLWFIFLEAYKIPETW